MGDHLRVYLEGIFGCMMALMWLFILLLVILFIFSIAFVQATTNYLINSPDGNSQIRDTLKDRFRNVPTGILSLFSLMAGGEDWGLVEGYLAEVGLIHRLIFDGFLFFTVF